MKFVLDIDAPRHLKCYFINDNGVKDYVDFWDVKTDTRGNEIRFNSYKDKKTRQNNYDILAKMRKD